MSYIDGFVAAVPTAGRGKFRKDAEQAAANDGRSPHEARDEPHAIHGKRMIYGGFEPLVGR